MLRINLALQGGGAHGAFTWGVLDRLLQEDDLKIEAISGTSAGALNGAALKSGYLGGGREGARATLDWLWAQMGAAGDMRLVNWLLALSPGAGTVARMIEASFPVSLADTVSRVLSPYSYGPFYMNPLQRIVERFDFDRVCAADGPALFVGATNVRTGKVRIFAGDDITPDALLASACLPNLFRAVEIHDPETGETGAYWDGGYTGNPALFPLFDNGLPNDIVIVGINPVQRCKVPKAPQEIQNRINEISFNSSLLREIRSIKMVKDMLDDGLLERGTLKEIRLHMVADDSTMRDLSVVTKMVASPVILYRLKDAGRAAAEKFLCDCKPGIGRADTLDMAAFCG
ncbi:NTE family protein [Rhodovulum imhoffii]|uniref:NTE family protein n=1 Tax=Rhodovulum imhoffii TaxID=365340 RepID=A0A2T5BTQ2_9RHOB|nr:patatin-like phospholipase family protein [Rhodovulum imhoffii]MBK5934112.1 patatin [Rhodovulum imhoffii]PTN02815.1 NTE family protein [Rhodovulum imhoffii]